MNLENLGVQELSTDELQTIDGGWLSFIRRVAVALAAIHEVVCDGSPHMTKQMSQDYYKYRGM